MASDKRKNASRKNGAKSQGPVTEEGKANSSQNAVRHNLCTGHLVLLSNEDPFEYHHHMNDYIRRFHPVDGVELDLVQKMIAASWREKRITAMETSLFELEMDRQRADVDDEFIDVTPAARQTLALFGTSDVTTAAALLLRYASTARRAYASAFRLLRDLQGDRFNRMPAAAPEHPYLGPIVTDDEAHPIEDSASSPDEAACARASTWTLISRRRPERHHETKTPIDNSRSHRPQIDLEITNSPNEPEHATTARLTA